MATSGISDVAVTIETIVSALTTRTLLQNSVALAVPGIWDRSNEVGPGMDQLDMILLANLAVQTVSETGIAMTAQTITPSAKSLILDQHKSVPFSITNRGLLQSKVALVQRSIETGVRALAAGIDDYCFSQAIADTKTTTTVAAADGLAAIRDMAKLFDQDNVPKEGRSVIVSPGFLHDDLLATASVIKANEFGSAEPVKMGAIANIYGFLVFESSSASIAADGFLGLGMEALAFARQKQVSFEEQNQVLNQQKDYALTHLFGAEATAATNPRIYVYDPV